MGRTRDERKFERIHFEQPVVIDVQNQWTTLGTAADLSLGGMFVAALDTEMSIPFGTRVTVHVRVSGEVLALPAVVRWARGGGIGVQFGLLGARDTWAITEAIGRHAPSEIRERAATIDAEIEVDLDDVELAG